MREVSAFAVDSSYGRAGPESIEGRVGLCMAQLWMRSLETLKAVLRISFTGLEKKARPARNAERAC